MVLYEAQRASFPILMVLILTIVALIFLVLNIWSWKRNEVAARICLTVITALLLAVVGIVFVEYSKTQEIFALYECGEYQQVTGVITDYTVRQTDSQEAIPDDFLVSGITFYAHSSGSAAFGYGYPRRSDGGQLENGQIVMIYYSPYQYENVILKILLLDDNSNNDFSD